MAPTSPTTNYPDFLKTALDFSKLLPTRLRTSQDALSLSNEIRTHIKNIQSCRALIPPYVQEDLDGAGTELWNTVIRLKHNTQNSHPSQSCLARAFAFSLIDCSYSEPLAAFSANVRILKIAVKAAHNCLQCDEIEIAQKMLERTAQLEDNLSKQSHPENEAKTATYSRLHNKYLGLRIVAAWKCNNLDLADNMFLRIKGLTDAEEAEELADVLLEIGKDRLERDDISHATTWLERSYDTLLSSDINRMSPNAPDLKLNIMHNLVRILLKKATPEAREKAKHLIGLLDKSYGERIVVPLLQMEIISTEIEFDSDRYSQVLYRLMSTGHITATTFQAIMQHIHKLKLHSVQQACEALDSFMTLRLLSASNVEWAEKAFITRIWICTEGSVNPMITIASLETFMNAVFAKSAKPLSETAVHAAQTLFWKRIDAAVTQQAYEVAESWCHLAIHDVMQNGGDINRAKLQRKIVLCAIERQNFAKARATLNEMSEQALAAPLTNYITYKIALKECDGRLATQCLEAISKHSSNNATLLYACVLEAQQSNDRQQAIIALQAVLQKYELAIPSGVHLPTLLRCNARLLLSEMNDNKNNHIVRKELCQLFRGVATKVQDKKYSEQFSENEVDWFIRNSYNLGVKHFGEWDEHDVLTLLEACLAMFSNFESSNEREGIGSTRKRLMVCQGLASQTLLKIARSEKSFDAKLQYYFHLREHVNSFRRSYDEIDPSSDGDERQSLSQLFRRVLLGDFEAAIHLKRWDDLETILKQCSKRSNKQTLELLVDMILAEEVPSHVALKLLESIVSDLASGATDISKTTLAYWLRILYQLSMNIDTGKSDMIVHRACTLASTLRSLNGEQYPQEELEWFAMTTYNRSIDAYCADELAESRKLAEQSFELAAWLNDGGCIRNMLMEKFAGLQS